MPKIAGSGSINQRHGSADPDPDPDPHQNVMDPQHWFKEWGTVFVLKVGFKGWARRQEPSEGIVHCKDDPIYLFPEMKLRGLPESCICERFIYSHDRSTYFEDAGF